MCGTIHTRQASAGGHARHAVRQPGPAARIPPLTDPQGDDVTSRWPLRSFLGLGALPSAVPCARLHTRQLAWEWQLTAISADAELIVSEIVTNAVHITRADGRADSVRLWLLAGRARLLILVQDASPLPPVLVPVSASGDAENGRGLLLVDTLSTRWGHFLHVSGGKVVWSLLEALSQPTQHSAVPYKQAPTSAKEAITDGRAQRIHRRYRTGLSDHRPRVGRS